MTPTTGKPKRNDFAAAEFSRRVRTLAKRAGEPSAPAVTKWIADECGYILSAETVRRALKGDGTVDPETTSVELLLGLCRYFHCEPKALGGFAARRIAGILGSFDNGGGDLRIRQSGCNVELVRAA